VPIVPPTFPLPTPLLWKVNVRGVTKAMFNALPADGPCPFEAPCAQLADLHTSSLVFRHHTRIRELPPLPCRFNVISHVVSSLPFMFPLWAMNGFFFGSPRQVLIPPSVPPELAPRCLKITPPLQPQSLALTKSPPPNLVVNRSF